jgi:hypothetical protein
VIRDGKAAVEYDGSGYGIAPDLIAKGIPENDIVFAGELASAAA